MVFFLNVSWAQHSWTLFSGVHGDYFFTNDSHPCDFFIQNGGHSGNICVQQDLYPFFMIFFLGIRLNSLLEITAFASNPSKLFYDGNRALYQPIWHQNVLLLSNTELFTLLIAELNIVTLCWMVSRSFDLVIPIHLQIFPTIQKDKI